MSVNSAPWLWPTVNPISPGIFPSVGYLAQSKVKSRDIFESEITLTDRIAAHKAARNKRALDTAVRNHGEFACYLPKARIVSPANPFLKNQVRTNNDVV